MVLGGYGIFGGYVCRALCGDPNIALTVAGRDHAKAHEFARKIASADAASAGEVAGLGVDVNNSAQLREALRIHAPHLVIHTCGPFQGQGYHVAKECIHAGVNYVDLADGREFVCEIDKLDEDAKKKNVVIISGASSVPGLSGAVVEKYKKEYFESLDSVEHYISPGNKTERGVATVQSVLAYCGKEYKILENNKWKKVIGWQDTHNVALRGVGSRTVSACDIPDLELFPKYFEVPTVKFYAGLELKFLHLATVAMSHLVRYGVISRIDKYAAFLRKVSLLFFNFGSKSGGMSVRLRGKSKETGGDATLEWQVGVHDGDGPQVPSIAAVVIARKLAAVHSTNLSQTEKKPLYPPGARACLGFFSLEELQDEMKRLRAYFYVEKIDSKTQVGKEKLYEKAIGESYFAQLPASLQKFHSTSARKSTQVNEKAQGTCVVTRGGFVANLIATILRLPAKSSTNNPTSVEVYITPEDSGSYTPNAEVWHRKFDGKPFVSKQLWSAKDGLLIEEYGSLLKLGLRVRPIPNGFAHDHVFTKLFGVKLPLFMSPAANATTIGTPNGWIFDVKVTAPLVGLLVRYQGAITSIK